MMAIQVSLPVPPVPPTPQVIFQSLPPWMTLPPAVTVLISLGFFAVCGVVLYPLMRAIGRRIEGKSAAPDPGLRAELDQMAARLQELEQVQHRVLELEERLDFAERMLAQRRDPDRLERGRGG